jgi:hypothetical protein
LAERQQADALRNKGGFMKKIIAIIFLLLISINPCIAKNENYWEKNNCTRGASERTLDKSKYKNVKFSIDYNAGESTETATMNDGTLIKIKEGGCEYATYKIKIDTDKIGVDATDNNEYYRYIIKLFAGLYCDGDNRIFKSISNALDKLMHQFNLGDTYPTGNEIDLSEETGMHYIFELESVTHKKGRTILNISYSVGPL